MPVTTLSSYIYENLKHLADFNDNTGLYMYEATRKLYVVKKAGSYSLTAYEAIMALDNPHLAKIIHIADKTEYIEIVREYISGDVLSDLLKGGKTLDIKTAVGITADICDGLTDLHKIGFVHRDINPNNIIISSDGRAKIIDYGITRSFSQDKSKDTCILGTPGYAAPEQFGFSQSEARTDIYAVGVLMNVMITGKLPNEETAPGGIGKIIRKCVAVDPEQRYKSMEDLKNAVFNRLQGDSPMDNVIRRIPGVRSPHALVVAAAVIGYTAVIIFSAAMFATVKNGKYLMTASAWIFMFAVPFFCFNNFLDIWNRLPFSSGAAKRNQRIVYTVFGILSAFFGVIIFDYSVQP